jgi:hypothetical protein
MFPSPESATKKPHEAKLMAEYIGSRDLATEPMWFPKRENQLVEFYRATAFMVSYSTYETTGSRMLVPGSAWFLASKRFSNFLVIVSYSAPCNHCN